MKIFHKYSNANNITPTRGDFISEFNIIKAMKKFAVVDCNERTKHDLYYVRYNPKVFRRLPHKKIYFASPYNATCFKQADAIATFSTEWTNRLKSGTPNTSGCSVKIKKPIITIQQVIDDSIFKPMQGSLKVKKLRRAFGGGIIIGQFGKMRPTNYPYTFLKALPELKKKYPDINVIFSDKTGINSKHIKQFKFNYKDMPYVLSACDILLFTYWSAAGHYSGALRIKEAMACGVPIISARFKARIEELDNNYPFFTSVHGKRHSTKPAIDEMVEVISKAIDDKKLRTSIGNKMIKRSKFYGIDASAARLKKDFMRLLQ